MWLNKLPTFLNANKIVWFYIEVLDSFWDCSRLQNTNKFYILVCIYQLNVDGPMRFQNLNRKSEESQRTQGHSRRPALGGCGSPLADVMCLAWQQWVATLSVSVQWVSRSLSILLFADREESKSTNKDEKLTNWCLMCLAWK